VRILLCASEIMPFAKTGGLADVAGSLPKALAGLGHDVRVALPKYALIDETRFKPEKIMENLNLPIGEKKEKAAVWLSEAHHGVKAYFIDNPRRFGKGPLYGHPDDAERFILYQRAVLKMLSALVCQTDGGRAWQPEIIHCNDWQCGLIPLYLHLERERVYPEQRRRADALAEIASVFTVHNLGYQGNFPPEALQAAGLPAPFFTAEKLEFYGSFSFMKAGLLYADIITTVSPTYAREIQTPQYGERMEGILSLRRQRLRGILNGLDYEVWDPSRDHYLSSPYSADSLSGKIACKKALQARLGLPQKEVPIIGMVSRLAAQKGFDLLEQVLPHLLRMQVQLVVLGLGDKPYHDLFKRAAKAHPECVSANLEFNEELAHQIYAGADMFLMPSRYEPCGLGQMISLRYGTLPIVRATGGLADTVEDYDPTTKKGNGFRFQEYSAVALLGAIVRALFAYQDRSAWQVLMKRGMQSDFSWQASARKYEQVYQEALRLGQKSTA